MTDLPSASSRQADHDQRRAAPSTSSGQASPPRAYLGLGGNLDDPEARIVEAVARLDAVDGLAVHRLSPGYRSAPHGPPGQRDYVNAVVEVETTLRPAALLAATRTIESELGRRRDGPRWGARRIDVDILLVDDVVLDAAELTVPHPRIAERRFVLRPLADLAPDVRHPTHGRTVAELLAACADSPLLAGPFTLPRETGARLEDHGGDLALRAAAPSPARLVAAAAHGLLGAIVPRDALREVDRRGAVVPLRAPVDRLARAELGEAIVDALTEILVWLDADGWLPARVTASFAGTELRLAGFGQSVRGRDLPIERSPKAVTRHGLRVTRRARGGAASWTAHLVIDL